MVVLPAPRSPTRATMRRSFRSWCPEKSSSPADEPKARATSCSRATEMFPCPDSSSARKRSETPLRPASSRRLRPRSSLRRRTAAPTADRRTWCSRVIYVHYIASLYITTSNIVLASAKGLRYLLAPMDTSASAPKLSFDTNPSKYRHWTLAIEGEIARLTMKVEPFGGAKSEIELKSNSYDMSVDIELADAIQRLRFEHPGVKCCVITSAHDKIFCAGANIYMLAASTHPFKVNFCKYTNETRLAIEDASQNSGIRFLAACNGATAGGGYELALACDDIVLIDDGSSTVALPEVPLLGVLPGTGGLTRVVDKRKVRRDLADAFSTLAEGVKGKRAVEWGLVDAVVPLRFERESVGLVIVRTEGDRKTAREMGELLMADDGFTREVRLNLARTLRRLDVTARSLFAVVDQKSCFSGPLFELLVACDRSYVLDADGVEVWPGSLSAGALPGWNGLSRLETRFLADPQRAQRVLAAAKEGPIEA